MVPADASIDLSTGRGEVELTHPDAVAGVDCGSQRCEIFHNALVVRSLSSNVSSVDVKFHLVPGVFVSKGTGVDAAPTAHLAVVHCPMSAASGPVLRGTDNARLVLRIEGRCADEVPSLRFLIGADPVEVLESLVDSTGTDVLVRVGSTDAASLTVTAVHSDDPGVSVAVARVDTISPPQSSASLEIPGHKNLGFVPTNRPAIVHLPVLEHHAVLVPLPVPGVYSVHKQGADYTVTGDPDASGLAALRFGYRNESLPGALADVDLGVLTSPLQRNIHEANLPAPIGGSALGPHPIVELVCGVSDSSTVRVMPGITAHLPFESRDNCRLIFHRNRLPASYGTQKMNLEIDVVDSDGGSRAEGHVSETIILRSGGDPIYAWIQGVKAPFDRVLVRLSHVADEAHYVGGARDPSGRAGGEVDRDPRHWARALVRDDGDPDRSLSFRRCPAQRGAFSQLRHRLAPDLAQRGWPRGVSGSGRRHHGHRAHQRQKRHGGLAHSGRGGGGYRSERADCQSLDSDAGVNQSPWLG